MRRLVVAGVILEVALLIVGLTWIGPLSSGGSQRRSGAGATATSGDFRLLGEGTGKTVSVSLVAQETVQTIAEGVDYEVWTFNGTAPGPVIRVALGDTIHFTLENQSSQGLSHSIDFHSAQTPWDRDYQPVAPGETLEFDWIARFPGVFMYHCGVPPVLHHIANGMYGAIIVEPEGLAPAREYVMTSSEFYPGTKANADGVWQGDLESMLSARPKYVVFDGGFNRYLDAPLVARPDELIRIWLVNAGPTLTNAFHVIGALFDHVYPDGNPANEMSGLQTYNVPPGAGAMFELKIPDVGLYPFVTHSFAYTGLGSVGVIQVAKDAAEAPGTYPSMADPFSAGVLAEGSTSGRVTGGDGEASTDSIELAISGYSPSQLMVREGSTLNLRNLDAFTHDIAFEGTDVVWTLAANEERTEDVALSPGTYTFYCSIPGHREAGMEGEMTVMPASGH